MDRIAYGCRRNGRKEGTGTGAGAEAEVEADADGGVYMVGQNNPEAAETAEEEDLSH